MNTKAYVAELESRVKTQLLIIEALRSDNAMLRGHSKSYNQAYLEFTQDQLHFIRNKVHPDKCRDKDMANEITAILNSMLD